MGLLCWVLDDWCMTWMGTTLSLSINGWTRLLGAKIVSTPFESSQHLTASDSHSSGSVYFRVNSRLTHPCLSIFSSCLPWMLHYPLGFNVEPRYAEAQHDGSAATMPKFEVPSLATRMTNRTCRLRNPKIRRTRPSSNMAHAIEPSIQRRLPKRSLSTEP